MIKVQYKFQIKRLKIYFKNAYFESSDDGDVTIKNSYDGLDYKDDIRWIQRLYPWNGSL